MNYATSSQGTSFVRGSSRARADWDFLHRLRDRWPHKLVVKGVQAPEDALRIKAAGADALYVSNHGARQMNAAPPAMTSIGPVRAAIGNDMPLIVDGGVRSGEHVIKAIASGADFVMIGRSAMFGLGAAGAAGLSDILDSFAARCVIRHGPCRKDKDWRHRCQLPCGGARP
jgi:L-lactate dehydrogenase (cytochrome)